MPYNKETLDSTMESLRQKIDVCERELRDMIDIFRELESISDETPIDVSTKQPMSESRKNEVYDANITRANQYIN